MTSFEFKFSCFARTLFIVEGKEEIPFCLICFSNFFLRFTLLSSPATTEDYNHDRFPWKWKLEEESEGEREREGKREGEIEKRERETEGERGKRERGKRERERGGKEVLESCDVEEGEERVFC